MKPHSIPWKSLRQLMQHVQDSLKTFAQLLVEEEAVMKRLDRDQMAAVVEQKAQALEGFHRHEQELVAVLRPWVPTGSIADCWHTMAHAPEFKALAQHPLFNMIVITAQRIRDQGQRNAAVIRRGQYVVQEAIHLMYEGLGQGPVYQGTGTFRTQPAPSSVNLRG